MFCGKCGAKNPDNAEFCVECGALIGTAHKNPGGQATASSYPVQTNQRNRTIGIAAVAVLAVIVVLLIIVLFGGRSYKATVTKFMDATFKADAKAMLSIIPDEMVDYMLDETGYDRSDMKDILDELGEGLQDELDYISWYLDDEDWTSSYKITGVEDVSAKKLREIKADYEEYDIKVSAAKNVEVTTTLQTKDTEYSNTVEVPIIKIGRSWYLDVENLDSIF